MACAGKSSPLSLYLSLSALYITVVPLDIDATREIRQTGDSEASILGIAVEPLHGKPSTVPDRLSTISS